LPAIASGFGLNEEVVSSAIFSIKRFVGHQSKETLKMRNLLATFGIALLLATSSLSSLADDRLPSIENVEIKANRVFNLNGKPFFPLMAWLQDAENFAALKACAMNTTAGYWPGSSGTKDVAEYLKLIEEANLYGVLPFDERLKGRPNLLGYIHDDEPDLPHQVSDAEVVPAAGLRINRKTPLWKFVDGVTHTSDLRMERTGVDSPGA